MQALIITCLLCLQTPNPCDPSQLHPFTEGADCSKCMTDLHDYFNLPVGSNSTKSVQALAESTENEISSGLKESLASLLADAETLAGSMSQNSDKFHDLINKMETEINQYLLPGTQSHGHKAGKPASADTFQKVLKQQSMLEKINKKFEDILHQNEALKENFKVMKTVLSGEGRVEETKKRRDTVMYGERLMFGEELVSKNGKWKYMIDPRTTESVLFDGKGNEIKREIICTFPKPLSPNLHLYMNRYVEYYLDIENGKSANVYCTTISSIACVKEGVQCHLKLDNDGHLKLCLPSGEPSYSLY